MFPVPTPLTGIWGRASVCRSVSLSLFPHPLSGADHLLLFPPSPLFFTLHSYPPSTRDPGGAPPPHPPGSPSVMPHVPPQGPQGRRKATWFAIFTPGIPELCLAATFSLLLVIWCPPQHLSVHPPRWAERYWSLQGTSGHGWSAKKILSCLINYHLKVTSPPLHRI